ncbi:MAG: DUF2079 domain-containing protein [Candidatus Levybacteria bacterium]|nr:DUF2079 domain-containing protein [Candidatus Levybacteria bacterium]
MNPIATIKKNKQLFILILLTCIYIAYFTIASFLRYDNFYTGRYDLGNMDQAVWNTINGRIFQGSSEDGAAISRLSAHADVMLVLISPLYLLWSHAKTLLITQTVVLSMGGIFVFLIANHVLKNKNLALIFGSLYLFNPLVQFTNLYDFHAVTFATPLLLASFYFLIKKKYFIMAVFLLLSGTTKEQVWAITSFFGLPLLLAKENKTKILGFLITTLSIATFVLLVWHVIPSNLGKEHFALSYFSDFGNSPTEVVKNTLFSPHKVIGTIFSGSQLDYLRQIFMPLGFLSFLAPIFLFFAIPDLLINLLSNNSQLHQIYYQYTSTITPFIFISAIYGVKQALRWLPKVSTFYIGSYLILFTALSAYSYGPLPGGKKPNLAMFTQPHPNKEIIESFLISVPKSYKIAATNNLGSHLSQRRTLYTIPEGIEKADIILFLLNDGFAQPSLNAQREMAENLKADPDYKEIFRKDDFIVFKRKNML